MTCAVSAAVVLGATVTPAAGPSPRHRYTNVDFTSGKYAGQGLDAIFEAYQSDPRLSSWGGTDPPLYDQWGMSTDPNQRVHLTKVGGRLGSWQELRSTDGPWVADPNNLAKASLNISQAATFGPGGFRWGVVRWFAFDVLFPLNVNGVSFEATATDFQTLGDLHSNGGDAVPIEVRLYPTGSSNPKYLTFSTTPDARGGGVGVPYLNVKLMQMWDARGNRITSAFNTWHEVVIGIRTGYDKTAWIEVWSDGVRKLARTNRRLFTSSESGPYFQLQNYTRYPTSYVGGATRSAVVYGGFRAGMTRADVQTRIARR
jgi:hypothetical protein